MIEDDGELAGKGRIVCFAVGNGGGNQMARAILVLQAFAPQRSSSGCRAEQEPAGALVGCSPNQIAYALKTKDRIIDIDGQQRQTMGAVRGGGSNPRRERAGFCDALFEQLPVAAFAIRQ